MSWLRISKRDERLLEIRFLKYGDLQGIRSIPGRKWDQAGRHWIVPYTVQSIELLREHYGTLAIQVDTDLANECPPLHEWKEGPTAQIGENISHAIAASLPVFEEQDF